MNKTKRSTSTRKQATHDRIVEVAARAIRRTGYGGTGVADIMKEAGLTHGGFYAHFASRDALLAEAADHAGDESMSNMLEYMAAVPSDQAMNALVHGYLSKKHFLSVETGCPVAAVGSEMFRQAPEVRHVATKRIKEMIALIATQLQNLEQNEANKQAIITAATLVGTLMLARAVDDEELANLFLDTAVDHLEIA